MNEELKIEIADRLRAYIASGDAYVKALEAIKRAEQAEAIACATHEGNRVRLIELTAKETIRVRVDGRTFLINAYTAYEEPIAFEINAPSVA